MNYKLKSVSTSSKVIYGDLISADYTFIFEDDNPIEFIQKEKVLIEGISANISKDHFGIFNMHSSIKGKGLGKVALWELRKLYSSIYVYLIQPEARKFWNKMLREGLIDEIKYFGGLTWFSRKHDPDDKQVATFGAVNIYKTDGGFLYLEYSGQLSDLPYQALNKDNLTFIANTYDKIIIDIKKFQIDANKLARDFNSIREFKMWLKAYYYN